MDAPDSAATKCSRMSHARGCDTLTLALAQGKTVTAAAKAAHISRATATRRLADAEFREQVAAFRADIFSSASGQLAATLTEAVEALRGLLRSESEAIRLRAASAVIEQSIRLRDSEDITVRLRNIELMLANAYD